MAFARHQEVVELPGAPTFDLVIAHHVLEHLLNPLEVLRALAGSMVEGGVLHLSVPRLDAVDRGDHLAHCIRPGSKHILAFTRDCLVILLARVGLRVLETANDAELSRQLTRLPLFAIKEAPVGTEPATPLRSAERVLHAHAARFGQGQRGMRRWIPLGVVARILTGPHDANRQDSHLPIRYDTGRPRAVIRLRISQPRTTSTPCPAGLQARRPSPMMDLYRKNAFSTRP